MMTLIIMHPLRTHPSLLPWGVSCLSPNGGIECILTGTIWLSMFVEHRDDPILKGPAAAEGHKILRPYWEAVGVSFMVEQL